MEILDEPLDLFPSFSRMLVHLRVRTLAYLPLVLSTHFIRFMSLKYVNPIYYLKHECIYTGIISLYRRLSKDRKESLRRIL